QIKLLVGNRSAELSVDRSGVEIDRLFIEIGEKADTDPRTQQFERLLVIVLRTLGIADWPRLDEPLRFQPFIDEAPNGAGTVFDVRAGFLEIAWPAIVRAAVAIGEALRVGGLEFLGCFVERKRDETFVGITEVNPPDLAGLWIFLAIEKLTLCRP